MASHWCITGHLHQGKPKGQYRSIDGISTYYIAPPNGSKEYAVLILTDVMGHKFTNNQLLADEFAAHGYFAVMPDLFRGDSVALNRPADFDVYAWLRNHLPEHVDPIIAKVLGEMRATGCRRVAAAGYCIGAKYAARFLKSGVLAAAFVGHPKNLTSEDVLGIEGPLSMACGADDEAFTFEDRVHTEALLRRTKQQFESSLFANAVHGFAVRCDMSKPDHVYAKERAFAQAVHWFGFHLKGMIESN